VHDGFLARNATYFANFPHTAVNFALPRGFGFRGAGVQIFGKTVIDMGKEYPA
jgi:hypothetical protein